jgi:hypothetical protein
MLIPLGLFTSFNMLPPTSFQISMVPVHSLFVSYVLLEANPCYYGCPSFLMTLHISLQFFVCASIIVYLRNSNNNAQFVEIIH